MKTLAKLTKISDDAFNGSHPNGIDAGYTKTFNGIPALPIVGERYYFGYGGFSTSLVTEILSKDDKGFTFKTLYSTYKVEYGTGTSKLSQN